MRQVNNKTYGPTDGADIHCRLPDSRTDLSAITTIYNEAASIDNPSYVPRSPEDLARDFSLDDDEERENHLVIEASGELIGWGCCGLYCQRKNLHVAYHHVFLPARWRHRGIERAAWTILEKRVARLSADDRNGQAIYKIELPDTNAYYCDLLESEGYSRLAAHANIVRATLDGLPDFSVPEGIEIRPVVDADIPEIYTAQCEAFREHIHGSDPSEEDFEAWLHTDFQSDRSLWIVVWDIRANTVTVFILNYIFKEENEYYQRGRGYEDYILVMPAYRRRVLTCSMILASLYTSQGFRTRYHTLIYSKAIRDGRGEHGTPGSSLKNPVFSEHSRHGGSEQPSA